MMGEEGAAHETLWQDREIVFDCETVMLRPRPGEKLVETLNPIEDTKGNLGEQGKFSVTNLRMTWQSKKRPRVNVSVGFRCVEHVSSKASQSRFMEGMTETLLIVARFAGVRYEFWFGNLVPSKERRFITAITLHQTYVETKMYRDLKVKQPGLMRNFELQLLEGEKLEERVKGVTSVNPREEHEGTAYLTNIRFLWLANLDENFNASIPYAQIRAVDTRQTQYGWSLVVTLSPKSGGHLLGFRCDHLQHTAAAVRRYHQRFNAKPHYGVEHRDVPAERQRRLSIMDVASGQSADEVDRPVTCSALASDIDDITEPVPAGPVQKVAYHRKESVVSGVTLAPSSAAYRRRSSKRKK